VIMARQLKGYLDALDWVTHLMTEMPSESLGLPLPATNSMSGACSPPDRHNTSRSALSR
jgi:hypothetical protein